MNKYIDIPITKEHRDIVDIYAPKCTLGGFSNLNKSDLDKSSRLDYQYTGLFGEIAWYEFRYKKLDKLILLLDHKEKTLGLNKPGDGGLDDVITYNNKTRLVDIKTSHHKNNDIIKLNLIVPQREYHKNMIYICAFTSGVDRKNATHVTIAGWVFNEDIKKRWFYDPAKLCVKVPNLRSIETITKYI